MSSGGKREGAGRKKGCPNKTNAEREAAIAQSGLTPLDYLLSVLRNEANEQGARVDAAKAAAPYVHPKLANVQLGSDPDNPLVQTVRFEVVSPQHPNT